MTVTGRSRLLDYERRELGLTGRVERDQTIHRYVLSTADGDTVLGNRWREASTALRTLSGRSLPQKAPSQKQAA